MTTQISPLPIQRFYDNNNNPLAGGQLYTYIAGTTTPKATFTDSTGTTPNTNPVIMNARGEANVWLTPAQAYKFVLKDASSVTIWTVDQLNNAYTGSISVRDFGAVGDSVTDDTAAIQAATNAASTLGKQVYFPAGKYLYTGISLTAGQSCAFVGESTWGTTLILASGTATGFNCATELPVTFDKLTFSYAAGVTATAGAFISIPGGATMNANSRFRNLQMNYPWIGISATGAYVWVADTCFIGNYINSAIVIGNSFVGDAGDSTVEKCLFTTTSTTATAITHLSSGGLRLINNKNIGGFCFYQLNLTAGVNTSDMLATGNSIEGTASSGFLANRQSGTGTFSNMLITGNQFAGIQYPVNFNNGTAGWLNNITITGNIFPVIASGVGVNISTAGNFNVSGNVFSAANATSVAVTVAATASSGQIGPNNYNGFTTAISNLSTTTAVAKKVLQGTTVNITCSNPFAGAYEGSVPVAFPAGFFGSTPIVTATPNGGANGFGAGAFSANNSGVSIRGVASTNGAVITCAWRAEADY